MSDRFILDCGSISPEDILAELECSYNRERLQLPTIEILEDANTEQCPLFATAIRGFYLVKKLGRGTMHNY